MDITIEKFAPRHLTDVAAIHSLVNDGWSQTGLKDDMENPTTHSFVALAGGRAVAFCSYLVTFDAELLFVCTHPDMRGKGVATKLLTQSMAALPQEITNIVLEVRSKNTPALALYKKLGFTSLGLRKNFYSFPQDDAVVMELVK